MKRKITKTKKFSAVSEQSRRPMLKRHCPAANSRSAATRITRLQMADSLKDTTTNRLAMSIVYQQIKTTKGYTTPAQLTISTHISLSRNSASYQSNEPVQAESRRGVVSAVVERRNLVVFPSRIALLEERTASWIQCSHWLQNTNTM